MAVAAPSSAESTLVRRTVAAPTSTPAGTLVALHADGGDAGALVPFCARAASAWDVVALEAPRARNPVLSSGHGDRAGWASYRGYSWYRGDDAKRPEPASFGDSLWQVEQVLREIRDGTAARRPVVLLGHREGAVLALAAAALVPALLDGVVALDGDLPLIPGLALRLAPTGPSIVWIETRSAGPDGLDVAARLVTDWLHEREESTHGHR